MTQSELQEAKADLADLKAVRRARYLKGSVTAAGNGAETLQRQHVSLPDLEARISLLERDIRMAEGSWFGAIHLR